MTQQNPLTNRMDRMAQAPFEREHTDADSNLSRGRLRGHYRRESRLRRLKLYLAMALTALFLTMLIALVYVSQVSMENDRLLFDSRRLDAQLMQANTELDSLRAQLDELVKGRIPALYTLEYDRAITIEEKYVRNIIFTVTGKGEEKVFEYRAVIDNDTLSVLRPQVSIHLFDKLGIQIGMAEIDSVAAGSGGDRNVLDPGETRSYTDVINMFGTAEPTYFMLVVQEPAMRLKPIVLD